MSTFTLIAKACGSGEAPENTLTAIEAVRRAQAPSWVNVGLELDVRLSADAVLVGMHDAELTRTTNVSAKVRSLSLSQLRRVPTRSGESVPTLAECIDLSEGRELVIELHDAEPETAASLQRCVGRLRPSLLEGLLIASEHTSVIEAVRRRCPSLRTAASKRQAWCKLLLGSLRLERFAPRGHHWIVPETHRGLRVVTPRFVTSARASGDQVWVFVVESSSDLLRLRRLGVTGCFSTRPASLLAELAERSFSP